MDISQPLSVLIPEVCARTEKLLAQDLKIAQYRFGFYRVPFGPKNNEDGLVLQIWLSDLPSEHFPHEHRYQLRARVLKGAITKHLWEVKSDAQGSHQTVREICHDSSRRDSEVGGRVSVRCTETKMYEAGDMYEIPFGQIHSSTINSFPTVTIVDKTGSQVDDGPIHYAPIESNGVQLKEYDLFGNHDNERARQAILSVLKELSLAANCK
ncbi:MAG: hypothetical protein C5B53_13515 [Candidatus Melainabacteria bacterium]|nr:MAG: hypothetical protein C5B53_13515 [Candidatus Melainabacteria bacterium]